MIERVLAVRVRLASSNAHQSHLGVRLLRSYILILDTYRTCAQLGPALEGRGGHSLWWSGCVGMGSAAAAARAARHASFSDALPVAANRSARSAVCARAFVRERALDGSCKAPLGRLLPRPGTARRARDEVMPERAGMVRVAPLQRLQTLWSPAVPIPASITVRTRAARVTSSSVPAPASIAVQRPGQRPAPGAASTRRPWQAARARGLSLLILLLGSSLVESAPSQDVQDLCRDEAKSTTTVRENVIVAIRGGGFRGGPARP